MGRKFEIGKTYDFYNMTNHQLEFWQVIGQVDNRCRFLIYTDMELPIASRTEWHIIHQAEEHPNDEFIYVDSTYSRRIWAIPSIRDIVKCGFHPGRLYL